MFCKKGALRDFAKFTRKHQFLHNSFVFVEMSVSILKHENLEGR